MKTINMIFALLAIGLLGTLIINTLEHIFGISNVFIGATAIVLIAGLYVIYIQLTSKKCVHCNTKLTKNNTKFKDIFEENVCDKEECLLDAYNREREKDSIW